jgi:hypothetical protein
MKNKLPSEVEPTHTPDDDWYDEVYDEDTRERCPVCNELFFDVEGHIAEEQDEDHTVYAVHES